MKNHRLLAILFALMFVLSLLTGCGASAPKNEVAMDAPAAEAPMADMAPMESALSSGTSQEQMSLPENEKIITTMYVNAQTEDMDAILSSVHKKLAQLGGYIEAQDIYNGSAYASYRYRNADLTIRIPAENLSSFMSHVSENANVVSENTQTQNITLTYVAVESRLQALETEHDRLLELMEMAENMEDLLLIEARLTEVVAELEEVTAQLRVYDNQVSYSTVHLSLEEVVEYTQIEEEPETVWQRIATGFGKSIRNLGEGFVNVFVFLVANLPYLVLIAAIATAVVLLRKKLKIRKKARRKKEESQE